MKGRLFAPLNTLLVFGLLCLAASFALPCGSTGPCTKAHDVDNHTCSPNNCLQGNYWTTAVPGKCEDSNEDECREDGITIVVIRKKKCKEKWIGTECIHSTWHGAENRQNIQIADCYMP